MVVELVKMAEDTRVRRRLGGRSSGRGFGYNGCLVDQDIFISRVQCGEHLKPGLRLEEEQGTIVCLWGVVAAELMMVRVCRIFHC